MVARNVVPPWPSGVGDHSRDGVVGWVATHVLDGVGVGDGGGVVIRGATSDGVGAILRRSAAESGVVRLGAAAKSTERMPSQEAPTVTAVTTLHTTRKASLRCTGP